MAVSDIEHREANYFAMCLLMPERFVMAEIAKMGGRVDFADDDQIAALAKKFKVSVTMMALRLGMICQKQKVF